MQTQKQFNSKVKIKSLTAEQINDFQDLLTVLAHEVRERSNQLFWSAQEFEIAKRSISNISNLLKNKGRK